MSFEQFLDAFLPRWRRMTEQCVNQNLEQNGSIHIRIRHRRVTIFGVPQLSFEPKNKCWMSAGVWRSISGHIKYEWGVETKKPEGPYIFLKNDPGSLYPIDLIYNLDEETDKEAGERIDLEKAERWSAILLIANEITFLGKAINQLECGGGSHMEGLKPYRRRAEKLARRLAGIVYS